MRQILILLFCVAVAATVSTTAHARVAHADSETFSIDTVTSVDDTSAGLPKATRLTSIYPNPF